MLAPEAGVGNWNTAAPSSFLLNPRPLRRIPSSGFVGAVAGVEAGPLPVALADLIDIVLAKSGIGTAAAVL